MTREKVKLFEQPLAYYFENKFVITEDRAYFVPYRRELDWPIMRDILMEIFDLGDPEVYRDVEGRFSEGRVIVGSYFPKTSHVTIIFPEEWSRYVQKRIKEVFGNV
jgi:hypothetical protein